MISPLDREARAQAARMRSNEEVGLAVSRAVEGSGTRLEHDLQKPGRQWDAGPGNRRSSLDRVLFSVLHDEVCCLLGDHHHGSLRVGRHDRGHDGSIGNPHAVNPVQSQARVHDSTRPAAHGARPHGMIDRLAVATSEIEPLIIGLHLLARVHFEGPVGIHRRLFHDRAGNAHAVDQCLPIDVCRQEVRPNGWRVGWVG